MVPCTFRPRLSAPKENYYYIKIENIFFTQAQFLLGSVRVLLSFSFSTMVSHIQAHGNQKSTNTRADHLTWVNCDTNVPYRLHLKCQISKQPHISHWYLVNPTGKLQVVHSVSLHVTIHAITDEVLSKWVSSERLLGVCSCVPGVPCPSWPVLSFQSSLFCYPYVYSIYFKIPKEDRFKTKIHECGGSFDTEKRKKALLFSPFHPFTFLQVHC